MNQTAYAENSVTKSTSQVKQTKATSKSAKAKKSFAAKKSSTLTASFVATPSFASFQNTGDPGKNHGINALAYSLDGLTLATVDNDGLLKLWDTNTGKVLAIAESETYSGGGIGCVVKAPDDACDQAKKYKNLWPIYGLAYSADGKTIVTTSGGINGVKTWDATTLQPIRTFSDQGAPVKVVAFNSSNQQFATGITSYDKQSQPKTYNHNTIVMRDANTGGDLHTIPTGLGAVTSLAFSPNGQMLASTTTDQAITLWDANTGQKIRNFDIHNYLKDQEYANAIAFSPDGLLLATGGVNQDPYGGVLKIWQVSDATVIKTIQESGVISAVAFTHDGKKLAAANFDKKIRLYEVASGKKLAEYTGHTNSVGTIAFSPDDKTLASSCQLGGLGDATIKFWKVP